MIEDRSRFQAGMKELSSSGASGLSPSPTGICTGMPSASRYW